MLMSAGPKGVDPMSPIGRVLRRRREHLENDGSEQKETTRDAPGKAIVSISTRASMLSQALSTGEVDETLLDEKDQPVDSRKTAEAIMKQLAPDLYQALVDAGEIEE